MRTTPDRRILLVGIAFVLIFLISILDLIGPFSGELSSVFSPGKDGRKGDFWKVDQSGPDTDEVRAISSIVGTAKTSVSTGWGGFPERTGWQPAMAVAGARSVFFRKREKILPVLANRIAFLRRGRSSDDQLATTKLLMKGVGESDLIRHPIDGWILGTTENVAKATTAGSEQELRDGIESLTVFLAREDAELDFVSPIFIDPDAGGRLVVTPTLLVGFDPSVTLTSRRKALSAVPQISALLEVGKLDLSVDYLKIPMEGTREAFTVLAAANALSLQKEVLFAEPDMIFEGAGSLSPNDPEFGVCWGLRNTGQSGGLVDFDMDADEAWDRTVGAPSVKVLIIDVGVQQDHPDINQLQGRDFTSESALSPYGGPVNNFDLHGTPVAGAVSATINNSTGAVGVAPGVKSVSARCFISTTSSSWTATYSWTADALYWAAAEGVRVSNNSNGYGGTSAAVATAYQTTKNGGMVHFASAGNNATSSLGYPANLATVNAVAASNRSGARASFSQWGTGLAFTAPGESIRLPDRTGSSGYSSGDLTTLNGTSFASPYTAGVAALVLSLDPFLNASDVESLLQQTCVDMGSSGYDSDYGWGHVNAGAATAAVEVLQTQSITFDTIPDKLTTDSFTLAATGGGSGNPVTFAVAAGPAIIGSGNVVSFTGSGLVTITASQAGSVGFEPAADESRTFQVIKATAIVTLTSLLQVYDGGPHTVTVTTSPVGLPVSLTYNGSSVVPVNAGSYQIAAAVNHDIYQGGNSDTLVIEKMSQSITFAPIPEQEATTTLVLSAGGGGSGNSVTFTVTEGPASLNGNVLTFSGTGDVSIRADQAGNANYEAAAPVFRTFAVTRERVDVFITGLAQPYDGTPRPVTVTTDPNGLPVSVTYAGNATPPTLPGTYFVLALVNEDFYEGDAGGFLEISKGVQAIDFPQPPDVLADATVTLAATGGPSGNPVTFELVSGPGSINGNQLSFTASGSVTVRALLAGNELYEDATPVERTLLVTKANAAVTLTDLQQTYDGSGKSPSASTIPAGLAVAFTFDGIPTPPVDAGSYDVVATVSDPRYQGSTSGELVIDKASQTIDFPQPSDPIATDTIPLSATGGGSGEPVLFQVLSGPASISGGNQLSFSGAGSVLVEATQASTANHLAALPVQRTLTVSKAPVGSLTLTNLHQVFDGSPRPVLPVTQPPGLVVLLDYAGSVDAPTGTGSHAVTAVIDDPVYEGTVTGQLVVDDPFRIEVVAGGTLPPGSVLGAQTVADFEFSPHEVTGFVWNTVRTWANANGYDFGTLGDSCAADHPVQGINWFDAVKWCNARTEWENALRGRSVEPAYRVGGAVFRSGQPASADEVICDPGTSGYRLPSAIEREFAVRGGATPEGTIYPGSNDAAAVAWFAANAAGAPCDLLGGRGTRPAGLLAPNGSGFYDLSGNVAEWGNDPVGTLAGDRQVGGGSWDSAETGLRSDALVGGDPSTRDSRQGLRVTRSLSQSLAEGVDRTNLTWTSGGAEPWIAESGVNGAGTDAAGGEMPGVGEENWIETTASGPGNLSFLWRIATAGGAAELVVAVDGSDQAGITGDTGFVAGSVYLPTGSHTIRWTLSGLASVTPIPGRNAAWLDQVVVTPATLPVVEVTGVGELGESAATPAGSVPDDGGSPVTARGFRITPPGGSATDWPASGGGAGVFSVPVDSLLPGTTYRLVAYATNEVGTADSAEAIFTTDETVTFTDGLADRDRTIESGDGHGFLFSIEAPRRVLLASTGGAGLRAELYDGQGGLIASFEGTPDFLIDELLLAGDYELRVIRGGGGGAPADFSVQFDATELAESLPDVSVGPAPGIQIGKGVRNGGTGQVALLVSPKARAVVGFAEVANAGILPDRMRVFAARGNSTFQVLYLGSGGNITAALNAGGFETSELAAGGEPERIRAFVTPNKRLIVKKVKRRTVTLKRTLFLPIRATSTFDPGETDSASIQVKTR